MWQKIQFWGDIFGVIVALLFAISWAGYGFGWWSEPMQTRADVMAFLWYFTALYFGYSAAGNRSK